MNTNILKNTAFYICILFVGVTFLPITAMSQDIKSEYTGTIIGRGGLLTKMKFESYYNGGKEVIELPIFFSLLSDKSGDCSWFAHGDADNIDEFFNTVGSKSITITGVKLLPLNMPSGQKTISFEGAKNSKLIFCSVESYTIND